MAPKKKAPAKRAWIKGTWTAEEDRKLAECIEIHGVKKWKTVATESGLNRCGKSCRLRWLNYLRPNIKRGNISPDEEDLILRLHKLLGNRWSLIAGRIPGRTDNEIKNYWNSHLSKKVLNSTNKTDHETTPGAQETLPHTSTDKVEVELDQANAIASHHQERQLDNGLRLDDFDDFFNDLVEETSTMDWISKFLELDENSPASYMPFTDVQEEAHKIV